MSESAPGLAVDSVTGIDVSLAVAGPGARSYAFLIDWNIRLILAFAWYACGALLFNGRLSLAAPAAPEAQEAHAPVKIGIRYSMPSLEGFISLGSYNAGCR